MSHDVTCHVTIMSHASSSSKRKSKRKENKINIKSKKLNKRKEKLSVFKAFHNNLTPQTFALKFKLYLTDNIHYFRYLTSFVRVFISITAWKVCTYSGSVFLLLMKILIVLESTKVAKIWRCL